MQLTLQILIFLFIILAFAPLIKTHYWWIRIWDFPRIQVAIFCLVSLVLYLWLYPPFTTFEYIMLGLLGCALIYKCIMIYPFTFLSPVQALPSKVFIPRDGLSMMLTNVRMSNKEYSSFLKLVHKTNPDILLINEPNEAWHQAIKELDDVYPYFIKYPLENTYGMMLYSKLELLKSDIRFLVEDDIPSFYTIIKLGSGRLIDFFSVHPEPPAYDKNTDTREAELLQVAKLAKETPYATIVAGDLNDVAWSHTTLLFKKISGLLDPRIGRGFFSTYNAKIPFFRYPLDHVFYDPAFRLVSMRRLGYFGSDHFPIYLRLNFEPKDACEQEITPVDRSDEEEAEELIEKGKDPEKDN